MRHIYIIYIIAALPRDALHCTALNCTKRPPIPTPARCSHLYGYLRYIHMYILSFSISSPRFSSASFRLPIFLARATQFTSPPFEIQSPSIPSHSFAPSTPDHCPPISIFFFATPPLPVLLYSCTTQHPPTHPHIIIPVNVLYFLYLLSSLGVDFMAYLRSQHISISISI